MYKIRYNNIPCDISCGGVVLHDNNLTVNLYFKQLNSYHDISGMITIQDIQPYHSYAIVIDIGGKSKNFRQTYYSDFKVLDLNRLGSSIKMDFGEIALLYSPLQVAQIDTGVWSGDTHDMVITMLHGAYNSITVPDDFVVESYDSTQDSKTKNIRTDLWDGYSITINGIEQYRDRHDKVFIDGDNHVDITNKEYINVHIQKYHGEAKEKLNRECDNEEVFIDCSCGVVDTKRVKLHNGEGDFKIFPFGFTGEVALKLGRKFYDTWNDYTLIFQKSK